MATVASAITRVRRIVNCSDTVALEYLQIALDELSVEMPITITSEDISVTSGTREYATAASAKRIRSVEWVTSSTDRKPLYPTSIATLDATDPSWRRRSAGTPTKRYTTLYGDDAAIGLDPIPNTTTSGGYPVIRVHEARTVTLASNGDLPSNLNSSNVLVWRAAYLFAIDNNLSDRLPTLKAEYEAALLTEKAANADSGFFDVQEPPSISPNFLVVPPGV